MESVGEFEEKDQGMLELEMISQLLSGEYNLAIGVGAAEEVKKPEHLMAELAVAKLKASEYEGNDVTKRILNAFASKTEKLKKQLKKNNKQLCRQSEEYRVVIANFQKSVTELEEQKVYMQKSIEGKVGALKERATVISYMEERIKILQTAYDEISELVNGIRDNALKPELESLIGNISEVLKRTEQRKN